MCGASKNESEYYKGPAVSGLLAHCKACAKIARQAYYIKNKEALAIKNKAWAEANPERSRAIKLKYAETNKAELAVRARVRKAARGDELKMKKKAYYEENKADQLTKFKIRRDNNKEHIKGAKKKYDKAVATNPKYVGTLPVTDSPQMVDGKLTVVCRHCKTRFNPTNKQVSHRLGALNSTKRSGEANFYCSDACKNSCPLFKFMPGRSVDPRSKLAVDRPKNTRIRKCKSKSLKDLQCDALGHNYCEKCGDIVDVENHHTLPVAMHGDEAVNPASHILLCFRCHMEAHASCG
jgi:hypothetical protein